MELLVVYYFSHFVSSSTIPNIADVSLLYHVPPYSAIHNIFYNNLLLIDKKLMSMMSLN